MAIEATAAMEALSTMFETPAVQEPAPEPQEESSQVLTLGIPRSFNEVITDTIIFKELAAPLPNPPT